MIRSLWFAVGVGVLLHELGGAQADHNSNTAAGERLVVTNAPYHARGDGIHLDTQAIADAITSGAQHSKTIVFPGGIYLIDNRRGPLVIADFSGTLLFEKGACLSFLNPQHGGLWFGDESQTHGGRDIRFESPCIDYRERVKVRSTESALVFNGSRNVSIRSAVVRQSPGAGIVFREVRGLTLDSADIAGTLADGVHVANSSDGTVKNVHCEGTGDDCLSFVSYTGSAAGGNQFASGISSRHSLASGASVVGMSNVTLENLDIADTRASGIRVNSDQWTRGFSPRNIRIRHATIVNAGQYGANQGGGSGLELGDGQSKTEVAADDVEIRNSYRSGVTSGMQGDYRLTNVNVDAPHGPYAQDAFELGGDSISATNLSARNIPDYCLYFAGVGNAVVDGLHLEGCSLTSQLNRAVWADSGGLIIVKRMIYASGPRQSGNIFVGESGSSGIIFSGTRVSGKQIIRLQSSSSKSRLYFAE